jgi:hypothetical protein
MPNSRCSAGDIDILMGIPSDPYSDLQRFDTLRTRAQRYDVAGCPVYVAHLGDIVASRRGAGRPSDLRRFPNSRRS